MKLSEIQDLIKFVARSGATEVEIEQKDFKIIIKTDGPKRRGKLTGTEVVQQLPVAVPMQQAVPQQVIPQAAPAPAPAATPAPAKEENNYIEVKSPMIGTFYRSPSPDKPAFAEVGDTIKTGDVVCIIEAMKLFNEIESEVSGRIVKFLVDDSSPVEYDQPLMLIDPS
ncbi:MAG: acetyl-CoA carboxylase biotin carboxyl carrier protein [Flavobacteriales bacterium]|nr:acetyl-CoA carboxylase biotin carboxyl carrier protein [Flavobacteriales bacterium]